MLEQDSDSGGLTLDGMQGGSGIQTCFKLDIFGDIYSRLKMLNNATFVKLKHPQNGA